MDRILPRSTAFEKAIELLSTRSASTLIAEKYAAYSGNSERKCDRRGEVTRWSGQVRTRSGERRAPNRLESKKVVCTGGFGKHMRKLDGALLSSAIGDEAVVDHRRSQRPCDACAGRRLSRGVPVHEEQ